MTWPLYHQPDTICKLKLEESERVGLKINVDKTKLIKINLKSINTIILRGQEIEGVYKFVYLGATITPEGGGMGDLKNRIA